MEVVQLWREGYHLGVWTHAYVCKVLYMHVQLPVNVYLLVCMCVAYFSKEVRRGPRTHTRYNMKENACL